jgi:hypothetical protein
MKNALLLILCFFFFTGSALAEYYSVIQGYYRLDDCTVWIIHVYDDHDTIDPSDDELVSTGSITDCKSLQQPNDGFSGALLKQDDIRFREQSAKRMTVKEDLTVFPNPANEHIVIKNISEAEGHVYILDSSGREVFRSSLTQLAQNDFNINVAEFQSGIYTVHLYSEGEIHVARIIRE